MKKFVVFILGLTVALALVGFIDFIDSHDVALQQRREFGEIIFTDGQGAVTSRKMDTDKENLSQIYICDYNEGGVVKDYLKFGIYDETEIEEGLDRAIEFYMQSRYDE